VSEHYAHRITLYYGQGEVKGECDRKRRKGKNKRKWKVKGYTVPKIWQIFVGKEEEVPCRENFPVILGK
jgi:hypothetical protein